MKLENTFRLPVPVDEAWPLLLAVEKVVPCIPGATLDSIDGDDLAGRVKVKLGPITVTYNGTARFTTVDEANSTVVLQAVGNETRGSGRVSATMTMGLVDHGAETECAVTTDLTVTGKPAQFSRGVMAEVSSKLIDQFAQCLAETSRHKPALVAAETVSSADPVAVVVVAAPVRSAEPIDLVASAGPPILRRLVPVVVLALVAVLAIAARRRR